MHNMRLKSSTKRRVLDSLTLALYERVIRVKILKVNWLLIFDIGNIEVDKI